MSCHAQDRGFPITAGPKTELALRTTFMRLECVGTLSLRLRVASVLSAVLDALRIRPDEGGARASLDLHALLR
jgi:hypothetical protein